MLQSVNHLLRHKVAARNESVGTADDLLFDDRTWTIRHVVIDTGSWLPGKKVLIPPAAVGQPLGQDQWSPVIPVDLDADVVKSSPSLDADKPLSKQHEAELLKHYSTAGFGAGVPAVYDTTDEIERGDSHLRSAKEVVGYHISALDDDIGHVEDFITDDEEWTLRYVVVDTKNWLPGKKVLVALEWLRSIDWPSRHVHVELTRDQVKDSPEFDPTAPVNRQYEERLYDYYGRPVYWTASRR